MQAVERVVTFTCEKIEPDKGTFEIVRASALDWMAVGRAGAEEPVSRIVRDQALSEGGQPVATLFGAGQQVPARAAALVNGATSHALDYDDTHFDHIGHPSVAVFPASLAIAEQEGAGVQDWLLASLAGMEASIRVGVWLGRSHYQIGFHQTATAGTFGAAVAASRLLSLTPEQTGFALGLAATRASGLKAQFGTMGKPMNAGLAASAGVEAALWARRGLVSTPDALAAFADTHHGEAQIAAFDRLGQDWRFRRVSHKFHACCHGLHAALEAAAGLSDAQIKCLAVRTHPRWMSVCNQRDPKTGLGMKFSYKAALAAKLHGHDTASLDTYSDALAASGVLDDTRGKIQVVADDTVGEMQARLGVQFLSGAREERFHDLETPGSTQDRADRVRAKARLLIGPAAEEIWAILKTDGPIGSVADHIRA
jgi:2-methylcitrate dehydratase PrpD